MRYLRTNTAVRVTVGPFYDRTDGVTPETALTVTSCKLTLMVDDANVPTLVLDTAPTASGGANDMVHVTGDDAGFYDLELAAANVNYLGRAILAITDAATHCPVFHEFMILPAAVYDAMVLGTDLFDVSVTQVDGVALDTHDAGAFPADVRLFGGVAGTFSSGRPEVNATHIAGAAVSASTAQIGVNVVNFGGAAGTFSSGRPEVNATLIEGVDATNQIRDSVLSDATRFAGANIDVAISTRLASGSYTSPPSAAAVAAAVWDYLSASATTVGSLGKRIVDYLTGDVYARVGAPAGASVSADIAAVKTVADTISTAATAIKAKTDQMVFTIANKLDSSIQAAGDFAQAAADKVWSSATRILTAGTNIVLAKGTGVTGFNDPTAAANATAVRTELTTELGRIDVAVSTRLASASYTAPPSAATNASAVRTELATELARLDVAVSTRLATAGYTAPDNATITAINVKTTNLPTDPADASDIAAAFSAVNATLATLAAYIDTEVAAIKLKTDNLSSDPADASDIAALLATLQAFVDTEVAAIKLKTDNLPTDPADASDIAASFATIAASIATLAAYVDTEIAAIKAKTDLLPAAPAAVGDIPTAEQNADALLARNQQGGSNSAPTVSAALAAGLGKIVIEAGVMTVKNGDGTTAFTRTVTRADLDAIVGLV